MRTHWKTRSFIAGVLWLSFALGAEAQFFPDSTSNTVSGSGVQMIKRKPDTLRLQVELSAKAKTLPEALAKLKTVREAAIEQLIKLSADKNSIKVADAKLNATVSDRQRQMEMMVQQRMRQGGRRAKKPPEKPVMVSAVLTAEWKLGGANAEALLIESQAIQDKVRAADLAGKASEEMSPEEEELAAEMEQEMMMYSDSGQPKPGEPMFIFVAKISADERDKAMAQAFAKAKESAQQLSRAAAIELGPLVGLSARSAPGNPYDFDPYGGSNYGNQRMLMQMMANREERGEENANEALGIQAGEVVLPISVTASFQIKPSK